MFFSVGDGGGGVVVVVAVVVAGVVVLGWLFPPPPQPAVSATITTIALAPATAGRRRAKPRELIEQFNLSSEYRFPDPRLHQTGTFMSESTFAPANLQQIRADADSVRQITARMRPAIRIYDYRMVWSPWQESF
jgi:hypothetical protein